MVELKDYAIGTLTLLLLISLGFNIAPDDTHFCRDLEISMNCDRLSSTGNTCYPTENTRIGSKYCSSGWEDIYNTPPEIIISQDRNSGVVVWTCTHSGCYK